MRNSKFFRSAAVVCCSILGQARATEPERELVTNFELDASGRAVISIAPTEDVVEIRVSTDLQEWEVASTLLPETPPKSGVETIDFPSAAQPHQRARYFTVQPVAPAPEDAELLDQWQQWLAVRPTHYELAIHRSHYWPLNVPFLSILDIVGEEVVGARDGYTSEPIAAEALALIPTARDVFSQARSLAGAENGEVNYDYLFGIPSTVQSSASGRLPIGSYTAAIRGKPLAIISSLPETEDQGPLSVESMRIIDGKLMVIEGALPVCSAARIELVALDGDFAQDQTHQIDLFVFNANGQDPCRSESNGRALFELGPLSQSLFRNNYEIGSVQVRLHTLVNGLATFVGAATFQPKGIPLQFVEEQPAGQRELPFSVIDARINDFDTLALDVLFPDCDNAGNTLVALPVFAETSPPQIDLFLRHNGNQQADCQALTRDRLYFDLGPLWEPMRAAFGKGATLKLNLNTVINGEVTGVDSLTWSPGGQEIQLLDDLVGQPIGHTFWPWSISVLSYDRLRVSATFPSSGQGIVLYAVATDLQESNPPQLNVYLRHTLPEDTLFATVITDASYTYDLAPLRNALIESYDAPEEIILNIHTVIHGTTTLIDSALYRPTPPDQG